MFTPYVCVYGSKCILLQSNSVMYGVHDAICSVTLASYTKSNLEVTP